MSDSGGSRRSSQCAERALRLMATHRVEPLPVNYTIWFAYAAGDDAELNEAVDRIVASGVPFSEDVAEDLHRRFIAGPGVEEARAAREEVRHIIDDAAHQISDACEEAGRYSSGLAGHTDELADDLDAADLRRIITTLVSETRAMMDNSQQMAGRLAVMSDELESVRSQFERVKREAKTDALTGLPNRKALDEHLAQAIAVAGKEDRQLCLIMADIDHFKDINDTHGHVVGDQVLRYVGAVLQDVLKGRDFVARYGGEEFAIVLEDTSQSGARAVAEQIRAGIESSKLVRKSTGEPLGRITTSLGIAEYRDGESATALIERADRALYRAKKNGRNQIQLASAA